jgi:hypothetical protein
MPLDSQCTNHVVLFLLNLIMVIQDWYPTPAMMPTAVQDVPVLGHLIVIREPLFTLHLHHVTDYKSQLDRI